MNIHTTKDYDKFKLVYGNRDLNNANIKRIRESVETDGPLVFIMIVNDKLEIIDGQHRFWVWKELGLPIDYIIKKSYGLAQVHTFNQNTKNWGAAEFMESYVSMKYKDYELYKFFKKKYCFGHNETMALLGGTSPGTHNFDNFRKGFFKVKSFTSAAKIAEQIYDFKPYYDGFKRRSFVYTVIRLSRSNGAYNHKQMLNKLSYQSAKLTDQSSVKDYLKKLEEVYNFRSRDDYVRFDLA